MCTLIFRKVAWSIATIGGVPIARAMPTLTQDRKSFSEAVKTKAQRIIEAKGATSFGIGSIVSSICSSILFDKRNVRPISHWNEKFGCCLSLPVVLGRRGVGRVIDVPLDEDEQQQLADSARSLKAVIDGVRDKFDGDEEKS
jgi:L-lactate dehydrogenase